MFPSKRDALTLGHAHRLLVIAFLVLPDAVATENPGHLVPRHTHTRLELGGILRMDACPVFENPTHPVLGLHRVELVGGRAPAISAQKDTAARTEVVVRGIADQRDRQVGIADPAIDVLVLLPETAAELEPGLEAVGVVHGLDGARAHAGEIVVDLPEDRERDRADTPVGADLDDVAGVLRSDVARGHAVLVLTERHHLRVVGDQIAHFPREGLRDHVHAAHRLKDRLLVVHRFGVRQPAPEAAVQKRLEIERLGGNTLCVLPTARPALEPAIVARLLAHHIYVIFGKRAIAPERLEQERAVVFRQLLVERPPVRGLGEKLRHMTTEIGRNLAVSLRLAAEGVAAVEVGVVVLLDEGLKLDAETAAVIEDGVVVVGDAPRAGVEVVPFFETPALGASPTTTTPSSITAAVSA